MQKTQLIEEDIGYYIYTCKCIYFLPRKWRQQNHCRTSDDCNSDNYTCAALFITELQSVTVHNLLLSSLTCDVWSKLKPVVICLPCLSLLWTFTSHVMPLIPLLLLNKEAYRGLPLWSCLVFCFLLRGSAVVRSISYCAESNSFYSENTRGVHSSP